jgi:hypothetical protein
MDEKNGKKADTDGQAPEKKIGFPRDHQSSPCTTG